jgi:hypothetical protein
VGVCSCFAAVRTLCKDDAIAELLLLRHWRWNAVFLLLISSPWELAFAEKLCAGILAGMLLV